MNTHAPKTSGGDGLTIQQEAEELFQDLIERGAFDPWVNLVIRLAADADSSAAEEFLRSVRAWDERWADEDPAALRYAALGALREVIKTWDDPWTWGWRSYFYPLRYPGRVLRHPLLWLSGHRMIFRFVSWLADRRGTGFAEPDRTD